MMSQKRQFKGMREPMGAQSSDKKIGLGGGET